jgi:hypothetical protein
MHLLWQIFSEQYFAFIGEEQFQVLEDLSSSTGSILRENFELDPTDKANMAEFFQKHISQSLLSRYGENSELSKLYMKNMFSHFQISSQYYLPILKKNSIVDS